MSNSVWWARLAAGVATLTAVVLLAAPPAALAQAYPTKTVRIMVPFSAGGSTDIIARAVAMRLKEELGQPFIIENKVGASGSIAATYVAHMPGDGSTLLFTTSYLLLNAATTKISGYDPIKDFVPITNVAFMPLVLLVRNDLSAKTVADVVKLAKQRPGALTYSTSGAGGPPHMAALMFADKVGAEMLHVPYGGAAPALLGVASGQVDITFSTLLSAEPLISSGRMRMLAVAYKQRFASHPDVPTFDEAGLPGLEMQTMNAFLAPAGTPPAIVNTLYAAIAKVTKDPSFQKLLADQGAIRVVDSPNEFAMFLDKDMAHWAHLAALANKARMGAGSPTPPRQ